jgi:hypothetical protein
MAVRLDHVEAGVVVSVAGGEIGDQITARRPAWNSAVRDLSAPATVSPNDEDPIGSLGFRTGIREAAFVRNASPIWRPTGCSSADYNPSRRRWLDVGDPNFPTPADRVVASNALTESDLSSIW